MIWRERAPQQGPDPTTEPPAWPLQPSTWGAAGPPNVMWAEEPSRPRNLERHRASVFLDGSKRMRDPQQRW